MRLAEKIVGGVGIAVAAPVDACADPTPPLRPSDRGIVQVLIGRVEGFRPVIGLVGKTVATARPVVTGRDAIIWIERLVDGAAPAPIYMQLHTDYTGGPGACAPSGPQVEVGDRIVIYRFEQMYMTRWRWLDQARRVDPRFRGLLADPRAMIEESWRAF